MKRFIPPLIFLLADLNMLGIIDLTEISIESSFFQYLCPEGFLKRNKNCFLFVCQDLALKT